jgi:hypothetical protein
VNPSTAAVARSAAVAVVLILAAVLGLVVGNALNARGEGAIGPGAGAASVPHLSGFDGARYEALDDSATGAPAYADPYRLRIQQGAADAADDSFTQTWGNLDERHDARSSDETSVRESLTAPTPR